MRDGDMLVVWKLDRLARSMKQFIETVDQFKARGIGFRSLTEAIDTTTAAGELFFRIFAALAQFERSIIRERTNAGPKAARSRPQGRQATEGPSRRHPGRSGAAERSGDLASRCRGQARSERVDAISPCAGFAQPRGREGLMPIRPQHRWIYPIDCPQISDSIRFGRAKGRCEHCGHPHGRLVFHLGDVAGGLTFRMRKALGDLFLGRYSEFS